MTRKKDVGMVALVKQKQQRFHGVKIMEEKRWNDGRMEERHGNIGMMEWWPR